MSAGSVVAFSPRRTRWFRPRVEPDPGETVIDTTALDGEKLVRAVVTAYVGGFGRLTVEGRPGADRRRTVRRDGCR